MAGGTPGPAIGLVSPHAGYVYSGRVAGAGYAAVEVPPTAVVLSPSHTGAGAPLALWPEGAWSTPLGEVPVDEELAGALLAAGTDLQADTLAHGREHSLELQLPFLQVRRPDVRIVPICIGTHDIGSLERLGAALAEVASSRGATGAGEARDVLIVASSDMTHYEPADQARAKDRLAIERMEALDPEGLFETVTRHRISMCGVAPATAMLFAARRLGASRGELVAYGDSGEVTGDSSEVVGYAAVAVRR